MLRGGDLMTDKTSKQPQKSAKSQALPSAAAKRHKNKIDYRWLIIVVILIVATIAAISINNNYEKTDSTKIAGALDIDNGDLKINWERYQTVDIELAETLTISESGTYHLTGTLTDGAVIVDAGVSEVRLILDNVNISNSNGPAIICRAAEDLVIESVGDNTLSDGSSYSDDYDEDIAGAIYSKADLTFQGEGTINLESKYQDAIVGKDDIKFNSGTYNITAIDDAIRGKDSVYIVDGNFTINSGATAFKSNNEIDTGKGFILIEGGNFNLTANAKGLSAKNSILIKDGNFKLDTYDDAIHSNNYFGFMGGNINITSGDDGIHADRELIVDGGNIVIAKSYEGLEAQVININNGNIHISATDDGINAGGGADESANNRPGANPFNADENCILNINGGGIYVNAAGDGVDSNGWLYFNGGKVVVDGPTNNGNGSLDSGLGIVMNGGEVIAVGSNGMAETLGNSSAINNISVYFDDSYPADTDIVIKDSNNEIVLEHTSAKTFNHLAAGTKNFKLGETYTIYLDDNFYLDFTISNVTTTIGNSNVNNMMPGPNNRR